MAKANNTENAKHQEYEFKPDELVMVARKDARAAKWDQLWEGPYKILAVRSDDIVVIDKERYQESIHMRRAKPFTSPKMEEDVVRQDIA